MELSVYLSQFSFPLSTFQNCGGGTSGGAPDDETGFWASEGFRRRGVGALVGEEAGEGRGGRRHRLHVKAKSNKGSAGSQIVAYV